MTNLMMGRWQDVLPGKVFHSVIGDPPYSPRTHSGYRTAKDGDEGSIARKTGLLSYSPLTRHDVRDFVRLVDGVDTCRWVILFGDDVTAQWWKRAFERRAGWYAFRPLPWIKRGATPRFSGDGPASDSESIVVARRTGVADGARPGHYITGRVEGAKNGSLLVGQKPLILIRALVRHYSRPGDVVCDPWTGSGTTALACRYEAREFIGTEQEPKHFAIAQRRLTGAVAPDLFGGA